MKDLKSWGQDLPKKLALMLSCFAVRRQDLRTTFPTKGHLPKPEHLNMPALTTTAPQHSWWWTLAHHRASYSCWSPCRSPSQARWTEIRWNTRLPGMLCVLGTTWTVSREFNNCNLAHAQNMGLAMCSNTLQHAIGNVCLAS